MMKNCTHTIRYTIACLLLFLAAGGCTPKAPATQDAMLGDSVTSQPLAEQNVEPEPEPVEEVLSVDVPPADDPDPLTVEEQQALATRLDIDIEMSESDRRVVEQYFKYFTHRARGSFERYLKRAQKYLPYARQVFKEKGLPEELVYLAFVESGFNPNAYSRAGAAGVWQFMPYTGRKYGLRVDWWIDERRDPVKAVHSAAAYLSKLYADFDDWYLAIAAYNAGEGKIGRAIKGTGAESFFELTQVNHKLSHRARLRKETRHYVPKLLAVVKIMRNLEKLGFTPIDQERGLELSPLTVKGGTDLLALAKATGMGWKQFSAYNPAFRRLVSPPNYDATIYLPAAHVAAATAFAASDKARPFAGWKRYRVRNGDSWYRISRKFGVPITVLKKVNKRSSNLIRPGQQLMIPGSVKSARAWNAHEKTRRIASKRAGYIVKRGDTLTAISKRYGVSVRTLLAANGLKNARSLRAGQKLYIPDSSASSAVASKRRAEATKRATVYRVRRGDNVWKIARRFGVTQTQVLRWNKLTSRSILRPGDTLRIFK